LCISYWCTGYWLRYNNMPKCVYIIAPTANFTLLLSPSATTLILDAVVEPVETTSGGNCQPNAVVEHQSCSSQALPTM
jgi:hypothetical protein